MRISNLVWAASFALLSGGGYGCWHQFPSPAPPLYQLSSSLNTPLGAAYPGTRELMNAPISALLAAMVSNCIHELNNSAVRRNLSAPLSNRSMLVQFWGLPSGEGQA